MAMPKPTMRMDLRPYRAKGRMGKPNRPMDEADSTSTPASPEGTDSAALVHALYMLGHALRFRLLSHVAGGPLAVGELAARTGHSISVVSQQLALLRKAGLVRGRREVKQVFYSLRQERMAEVARALAVLARADAPSRAATSCQNRPQSPIPFHETNRSCRIERECHHDGRAPQGDEPS